MKQTRDEQVPSVVHVRKMVWLLLIGAVLLALAVPVATTVQQSTATLNAQIAIWPAQLHVGQTAHVVVSLAQASDRAAARGPWAQLVATWDMAAMEMGLQQAIVQGTQNNDGVWTVPLQLNMPGSWLVHATLQTPGRRSWHGTVEVMVSPASEALSSSAASRTSRACNLSGEMSV